MTQPSVPTQGELQRTFVAMLFAFAVSVVAQQIAELLIVVTSNWTFSSAPGEAQLDSTIVWSLVAVSTHSFLALLMLCVSWVMWSRSQAGGHVGDLKEVFSVKFITFLVEAVLVTLYFSLSKSAEGDFATYAKQKTVASYLTPSSVRPEAMQMFFIFCVFAVWDFIVDVATSPKSPPETGILPRSLGLVTGSLTYCLVSTLCALGAIALNMLAPSSQTPVQAVFGDLGLVALLLFFNKGKTLEHYVLKLFPSEQTRKNTHRTPTLATNLILTALVVVYFSSLAASSLTICSQT